MNDLVIVGQTGKPVTSSLMVAEKFGKNHKDVIRSVRELLTSAQNCAVLPMFAESTYLTSQNKEEPMYIMNRDGFSLLVMGFTGAKALEFKIAFIEAFNRMEERCSMFQINAGMIRGIVREELRGVITPMGGSAPAVNTTNAQPQFKPCEGLTVKNDEEAKRFLGGLDIAADAKATAYANVCVLNAIRNRMIEESGKVMRRKGNYLYFAQIGRLLDDVWAAGWRHSLPTNCRRLCGRFYAYMEYGHRSQVHGNAGNQHARKTELNAYAPERMQKVILKLNS